ncbi:MAG: hypothetical protein WED05_00800 [Candidatus Atabeyarchaeum deiterrae]
MPDEFIPASSMAPIPNSSYSIRIGKIKDTWAIRVFRGPQVLATQIIGDLDPSVIVTVVQSSISLPSYSPYHIVRAVSPLIREAKSGYTQPPEVAPLAQPVVTVAQQSENTDSGTSPPPSHLPSGTDEGSEVQYPVASHAQASSSAIGKPPLRELRPLEPLETPQPVQHVEKSRIQKRIDLKPVQPEEAANQIYSALMSRLGLVVMYISSNYGEKSTARLWQYLSEMAELNQGKRKRESFEEFITRRVQEDVVLGIEHETVEFYEDKFASRVQHCGPVETIAELEKSRTSVQRDLPCKLCESTWQGACRAMGFQFQYRREKDGCTINVEKLEGRR